MAIDNGAVRKEDMFRSLPPEWNDPGLLTGIREAVGQSGHKVVVLDDDPTGSQTVHGVNILTDWSVENLRAALAEVEPLVFLLTNSRSLSRDEAIAVNVEIASNLARVARGLSRQFHVVSRGDSTLRGHYPAEIDALAETLRREAGMQFDGHILIPFFAEGGRFTIADVHRVQDGEMLVPVAQTEYAHDHTFGFGSSNLCEWIEEKTAGRYHAADVVSVSLDAIRRGGPAAVMQILRTIDGGRPVVVNCASYRDMEVFAAGLLRAEAAGKRFLVRSAASFVKVRGGIGDQPLLTASQVHQGRLSSSGGLVVFGSYIQKSSAQLARAQELSDIADIELNVARILGASTRAAEIASAVRSVSEAITRGKTVIVFTSRDHVAGGSQKETLRIAQSISSALTEVVKQTPVTPRFIVAKGGITSNDTATRGLGVKRARVLGQIAPGVPVWRLGPESRFPGLPYVVFPGNVGTTDTLAGVIETLRSDRFGSSSSGTVA